MAEGYNLRPKTRVKDSHIDVLGDSSIEVLQGKEIEIPTHTKEDTILLAQDFKLLQGDNAKPHEMTLETGAGDNSEMTLKERANLMIPPAGRMELGVAREIPRNNLLEKARTPVTASSTFAPAPECQQVNTSFRQDSLHQPNHDIYNLRQNHEYRPQNNQVTPKLKLPYYDGKSEWETFWMQFNFIAEQYVWDFQTQLIHLMSCLKDGAIQFVSRLPAQERSTLPNLVAALKQRFGDNAPPAMHQAALQGLKRNPHEDLQEYAARVHDLMTKAYPGLEGSTIFTNLTIEHLINGLGDQALIYDVMTKRPTSIKEAIDLVSWHECCRASTKKRVGNTHIRNMMIQDDTASVRQPDRYVTRDTLMSFGKDLQDQIKQMMDQMMKESRPRYKSNFPQKKSNNEKLRSNEDRACFKCGSTQHLWRSCPMRDGNTEAAVKNFVPNQASQHHHLN